MYRGGGCALYDLNTHQKYNTQPLFWSLSIAFSTTGGSIILGLFLNHLLPSHMMNGIIDIKQYKV